MPPAATHHRSRGTWLVAMALGLALAVAACGSDDGVGDTRADQVRTAAREAGLATEVADVLALAARGASATYQLSYPGEDGTAVVISQRPPHRRVDVVVGDVVVQSQVVRNGVGYACERPEGATAAQPLTCRRTQGSVAGVGTFSDQALDDFTATLAGLADAVDLVVEARTIAGAAATCLVSSPRSPEEPAAGTDVLCLSPEGAQLLVDAGGQRVEATSYRTSVPSDAFEV